MNDKKRMDNSTPDKEKKIKKIERIVLSVLMSAVVAAGAFVAGWYGRWGALGKNKQALLEAIDTLKENYYKDIDEAAFYESLYEAFKLDDYSSFYTAEELKKIEEESEGQNFDAGFSVYAEESHLVIYDIKEGSSAEKAETEGRKLEEGMYFYKFGRTVKDWDEDDKDDDEKTDWSKITAEDYFAFVATLKADEEYVVLCGNSEEEADVYTVKNDKKGAGISLMREYDPMRIYRVIGNSSADHAGLKRGMYILKYGESEEEMTSGFLQDFQQFINELKPTVDETTKEKQWIFYMQCSFDKEDKEAPATQIIMKPYQASYCYYRDSKTSYRIWLEDDKMQPVETKEPIEELNDDTAYIALMRFTGNAAEEFKTCLELMTKYHRNNLILDLRGNGGGYMKVFAEIAGYLLKDAAPGSRVVTAKFRDGSSVSYSIGSNNYNNYFDQNSHIYILADEKTASASECLIGALYDYGTIRYGDIFLHEDAAGVARTFGKGIMQTYYDIAGGNSLKITSAEVFWPKSGKSIHGVGVTAKGDGAQAIRSSLLPDENDSFLQEMIERIQRVTTE